MGAEWYQLTLRQRINGVNVANVFDYLVAEAGTTDNTEAINDEFQQSVLPLINAIQLAEMANVETYTQNRTDARYSNSMNNNDTGDLIVSAASWPIQTICLYTRMTVGLTKQFSDYAEDPGRPILRGKKYLAGVPEEAMASFGLDSFWLTSERLALRTQLAVTMSLSTGDDAVPIVHGYALASTPTKPAREEVYAEIVSASDVTITTLNSRKR